MNNFDPKSCPLVSVIMGVYNTPIEYLKEAVNSILTQTYSNLEFVIVDDCSQNIEVVEYLNKANCDDDRVKLIRNEYNLGLTKSLNIAIRNSSGKYLARMDSDDISLPERIQKQVEYMEVHKDICLTGTDVIGFSDNGVIYDTGKLHNHISRQDVCNVRLLFENTGYAHPSFMIRKSFLDINNIHYREDIKKAQDYALTTDCILAGGKRYLIEESLLKYRIHSKQISNESYKEQVECQAQTAYRRLRATFDSLSDDECRAIALLNHERIDYKPAVHISAIKKMIKENKDKKLFEDKLFRYEFYYEWYRKIMRIIRLHHYPWGVFHLFNFKVVPAVICIKTEDLKASQKDKGKDKCVA